MIDVTTNRGQRDVQRSMMAHMETGNHESARTLYRELVEYDYAYATRLRADVLDSYGIELG